MAGRQARREPAGLAARRCAPMKIALVWNGPVALDRISFRHENYQAGWTALGHDAVLVTARDLVGSFSGRTHLVARREELEQVETWRGIGADVAVGVTWHRLSGMLAAVRAAGTRVVAVADSDGQVGFAAHPRISWLRIGAYQKSLSGRLRALRYFCRRFAASTARRDPEEVEFVASTRASDRVVLGSAPAIACFARFLRQQRAGELAVKLREVPFAVPDSFCTRPLASRVDRVVAIGRWSDPQKDASLLAAALAEFFARRHATQVAIFGADSERAFGELAQRERRLRLAGIQEPYLVAETLAASRVALFSSRWETGPHAATEALALGATLVSAPMPNLEGMIENGRFGTLASSRRPAALAAALVDELAAWDDGRRNAGEVAAHWRARLSPLAVSRQLLATLAD
jgi:glycosyltransferase involved in cell wall biosynthesis